MSFPPLHDCAEKPAEVSAYIEWSQDSHTWELVFDGNGSAEWNKITFCPWCGVRLEVA